MRHIVGASFGLLSFGLSGEQCLFWDLSGSTDNFCIRDVWGPEFEDPCPFLLLPTFGLIFIASLVACSVSRFL